MFKGSSNRPERSFGASGIKYIVIILINELILIIKYLIRHLNGQPSPNGPNSGREAQEGRRHRVLGFGA